MTVEEFKKLLKTAPAGTDITSILPKNEVVKVLAPDIPTDIPIEGSCAQIRHSVNTGDLIAAMGCVKKYHELTQRKAIIMQTINMQGQYYSGAQHPVLDEEGRQVTFNNFMFDMAKPLIESQEYIYRFEKFTGQRIDIDFDVVRTKTFVNLPHGPIQGWLPLAFPDLAFDISKPWIHIDNKCPAKIKGQVTGKVILNFTERYRAKVDYFYLQSYAPDLIFAGTEKEHWSFCNQSGINIPRLEVDNFLDLAYALKECRFFMGNQSMCWGISQAMGVKRILEMCSYADNCFPGIGEDSYGYFYQVGSEYPFRLLYSKTTGK
jgi:hypothetical protein